MESALSTFDSGNSESSSNPIDEIISKMIAAKNGEHNVIVYPDSDGFRRICSEYAKYELEQNNGAVLLLPFYQTIEITRASLARNNNGSFDVEKYEKAGFLIIKDLFEFCMGSQNDRDRLIGTLLQRALIYGKTSLSVIVDIGSFYYIDDMDRMLYHEASLPPTKSPGALKIKKFCAYHKMDFDRLSEVQKYLLFSSDYTRIG